MSLQSIHPAGAHVLPVSALASAPVTGLPCLGPAGIAWTEMDPANQGRTGAWLLPRDGTLRRLVDAGWSLRSRVHEYGGGALWAGAGGYHWFMVDEDTQSLWGIPAESAPPRRLLAGDPRLPLADGHVSADGRRMVCLREDTGRGRTTVILLDPKAPDDIRVLDGRHAFCAAPRISPDGRYAAWLAWDDGVMPWETCRLQWMDLDSGERWIAGEPGESLLEPRWAADGSLFCLTDRDGAWVPARVTRAGIRPLTASRHDMGRPPWQLGNSHYDLLPDGSVAAVRIRFGTCELVRIAADGSITPIPGLENDLEGLHTDGWQAVALAGTADSGRRVIRVDFRSGERISLSPDHAPALPEAAVSRAETVSTATSRGRIYGFFYPPAGGDNGRPPLLVRAHGGPTAMRSPVYTPDTQFWTSRGFAVLDVNYSGSSGYGRAYRERLRGQWGLADRDDCISLARAMADRVDTQRMVIAGGSAGGLTVLNCLTRNVFAGGTSRYGVTDLELLAASTHRFEAGYLAFLLGPLPERIRTYRNRSPVNQARQLRGSVLLLQGEDDPVVPASQAHAIHDALVAAGGEARLVIYSGERHGFRRSENLEDSFMQELRFYGELFGNSS